jgi:hypothetical protein
MIQQNNNGVMTTFSPSTAAGTPAVLTTATTVNSSGLTINSGNLVIPTADKGISFTGGTDPDTSGTATGNTLDDYEEGTWTVGIDTASGGSITVTANNSRGFYTKVGNIVTVLIPYLTWTGKSGLTSGSLRLTGLPFPLGEARSTAATGVSPAGTFSSVGMLLVAADPSASYMWLIDADVTNNTYTHMQNANLGSAGTLYGVTFTYIV